MDNFKASVETEIKVMITKEECEVFFSKSHRIYSQINHYYKLNEDLCLRLRKAEGEYFIQYKKNNPNEQLKALKDKTEYSMTISEADFIIIQNDPNTLFKYLDKKRSLTDNAVYRGSLETVRGHVTLDASMPDTEIDINKYNDNIDYELEWEIRKSQYKKAIRILKKNGIDINNRVTGVSKYKRLTQADLC